MAKLQTTTDTHTTSGIILPQGTIGQVIIETERGQVVRFPGLMPVIVLINDDNRHLVEPVDSDDKDGYVWDLRVAWMPLLFALDGGQLILAVIALYLIGWLFFNLVPRFFPDWWARHWVNDESDPGAGNE